jgi:hypothetical protein
MSMKNEKNISILIFIGNIVSFNGLFIALSVDYKKYKFL